MRIQMKYLVMVLCLLIVSPVLAEQTGTGGQWIVTATGTASTFTCADLTSITSGTGLTSPYNGGAYYCVVLSDAGGSHVAPEGERRKVTSVSSAGLVTVDSAFTASPAVGDIIGLFATIEGMIYGSEGLPRMGAATKLAAGVSIAEGILYVNNSVDTLRSELNSTTGIATFPAGVFHANGVSIAEALAWESDSLRRAFVQLTTVVDSLEDANDILQSINSSVPWYSGRGGTNYLEVTTGAQSVDSTWSSVATHEVATITGPVELWIVCYDSVAYTGADSLLILFESQTSVGRYAKNDVDAGEIVSWNVPPAAGVTVVSYVADLTTSISIMGNGQTSTVTSIIHALSTGGLDFGYQIQTASAPSGILVFKIWWRDLNGASAVVAGAGGSL